MPIREAKTSYPFYTKTDNVVGNQNKKAWMSVKILTI